MIEDPEMNALFKAENEDRLHHLEEALKNLQKNPGSAEDIEEIFRDVHTVKGAARMLGVSSIEIIAHAMENGLDSARQGHLVLSPRILALFSEVVGILQILTIEATEGIPAGIDAATIAKKFALPALEALQGNPRRASVEEKPMDPVIGEKAEPVVTPSVAPEVSLSGKEPPSPTSKSPTRRVSTNERSASVSSVQKEETPSVKNWVGKGEVDSFRKQTASSIVRIHTRQLNELVTQARDLNVAKNRVLRLMEDIGEMWVFWEFNNLMRLLQRKLLRRGENLNDNPKQEINDDSETLIKKLDQIGHKWGTLRDNAYESIHKLDNVAVRLIDQINSLGLVPLKRLFSAFPAMVQELSGACGKEIDFVIEGEDNAVDKRIIDEMKDPLIHLVRNAIDHGIELPDVREAKQKPRVGTIRLRARQTSNTLVIELQDDGNGLDLSAIKESAIRNRLYSMEELAAMNEVDIQALIFSTGISVKAVATNLSGRGFGMNIVRDHVEKLHGTIHVESVYGKGCTFSIQLPTIFVTTHVLMIRVDGKIYAVPIEAVESNVLFSLDEVFTVEGQDTIYVQNQPVSVIPLADILGCEKKEEVSEGARNRFLCVVLKISGKRLAILVDEVFEEQKIVVTPFHDYLGKIPSFTGAAIMKTGEVCLVLNARDIFERLQKQGSITSKLSHLPIYSKRQKTILVVDDSNLVRVMLKRVLEGENYRVLVAEHGETALNMMAGEPIDALISDIEMPVMNGYELVSKVRMLGNYYKLPIILISTLSSVDDKRKGLEVGANAFINKSQLNSVLILDTLRQLLG